MTDEITIYVSKDGVRSENKPSQGDDVAVYVDPNCNANIRNGISPEQAYNSTAEMFGMPQITLWVRTKLKLKAIWWILMGHGVIFNAHVKGEFTIVFDIPTFAALSWLEHEDQSHPSFIYSAYTNLDGKLK